MTHHGDFSNHKSYSLIVDIFGDADTWWLETREGFYLARLCVNMSVWPTGAGPKPTDGQFRFHLDHLLVPEHDEYSKITDRERQHWWLKLYKQGWSVARLLKSYKAEWSRWHEEDPYAARRAAAGRLERGLLQAVCEAHDLLLPRLLVTTRRDRELHERERDEALEACQAH
jgi:hypothetical protein